LGAAAIASSMLHSCPPHRAWAAANPSFSARALRSALVVGSGPSSLNGCELRECGPCASFSWRGYAAGTAWKLRVHPSGGGARAGRWGAGGAGLPGCGASGSQCGGVSGEGTSEGPTKGA
jgi:hypothetical protein